MDVCNTGLVLAQCRILRCLQGKKNVIQKNFADTSAGLHRHLSTLAKRSIRTAKNNPEKELEKAHGKPVSAQKSVFGGVSFDLRFISL
ncbi:hypothetical protein [Undibacterium sp. WLX3042]|uniref:hypothetical protein n=1 Tax=Undibacterium sp. WLX3042 TaxID=3412686 RepID=UPI003C2CE2E5